ncbi:M48 family metallopeptidase [Microtetraspora malaysiensis]|uniref:M48 family metallopeptidase n=1 Tax=Microtetraspora malaysiensis TaxID=161358 RepID=UPI003D9036E5
MNNGLLPTVVGVIAAAVSWRLGKLDQDLIKITVIAIIVTRLIPFAWPKPVPDRQIAHRADYPDLHAMVDEIADALGARRPSRVCFAPVADSGTTRLGPRRSELWIGLPFAMGFERTELRAVIAFELAFLEAHRSWLLSALLEVWTSETGRKPAVRAELGAVVKALLTQADKVGSRVADPRTMANALLRGGLMSDSFAWFGVRYVIDLPSYGLFPVDLYQGWRWKVNEDDLLGRLMPRYLELHATQTLRAEFTIDRIAELGVTLEHPPQPAEDPILSALDSTVEARFARWLGNLLSNPSDVYWFVTFGEMPDAVWDELIGHLHDRVLQATAKLVGRPNPTLTDLVEIVADGRGAEIKWEHRDSLCTHSSAGVCALFPVLHRNLRLKGYRYTHALRQRQLVGPDGDRIDVVRLAQGIEHGDQLPEILAPTVSS